MSREGRRDFARRPMKKQSNLHNEWEQTATLSIPSRLDHVWILRAALSGLFHDFGMVEQDIHLLGIAVVEVANTRSSTDTQVKGKSRSKCGY